MFTKEGRKGKTNYNSMTSASEGPAKADEIMKTRSYTRLACTKLCCKGSQHVSLLLAADR